MKKKLNGGRLNDVRIPKNNKNNESNIIFFFNLINKFLNRL